MATRTIWQVTFSGGIVTDYLVLAGNVRQAAERAWDRDKDHQSHNQRTSMLVQVDRTFDDNENDVPQSSEDQLRARLTALEARVLDLETP